MRDITIKMTIVFEHVNGPESDAEMILDHFAFTIGRENGAGEPLVLEIQGDDDERSTYVAKLVDD